MKFSLLSLFTAFILLTNACNQKPHEVKEIEVIPAVDSIVYKSALYNLDNEVSIVYLDSLSNEAALLQKYLLEDFSVKSNVKADKKKGDIVLSLISGMNPEAYKLSVGKNGIKIEASSAAGIFYGIQTLRQIINENKTVEQLEISDSPAFAWRSFMLDEGRYFKGKEVVKQLMDEMARLKMNTFHWHLTDDQGWRIEIKKYPKLTEVGAVRDSTQIGGFDSKRYDSKPHGGFYTQDEIKEIVAYATERHITIVPEFEIPGHASASIAAYPWLGTTGKQTKVPCRFGVQYEVLNVANPKTIEFIDDVMDEIIALFPGEVFHIGGDEVRYDNWKSSAEINRFMKERGIKTYPELQVWVTNVLSEKLKEKGRRMMGWNEITGDQLHGYQNEKIQNQEQKLAEGTVVQFWAGNPELIKKAAEKGYDILNSHNLYTYLDYSYNTIPLKKAYDFSPVPGEFPAELKSRILGMGCQMWGEFIPTVKNMNLKVYPRIAAYAEVGWTQPENKNFERFNQSLDKLKAVWTKEGIEYYNEPTK